MKVAADVLATRLEKELDAGVIESDPRALGFHAIDGKTPSLLCVPARIEELSAALRICAEAEASVIPWGGGTCMTLGNIPRQVDVVITLERLSELIEHDDQNLTATAQAGMRVGSLQEILEQRNQFLAIDPPHPGRATIGGLVAANTNGPRRMLYGGVRDLVIGMKMALVTGEHVKAGGKVVKNVAGYDMSKLFVGSLGTLGIITEVTFKTAPTPESAATVIARGPLSRGTQLTDQLMRSTLLPAALAILNAEAAKTTDPALGMSAVAVWLEGFEQAVTRQLHDAQAMAEQIGLSTEILREGAHRRLWGHIRDFGFSAEGVLCRLTIPLASLARALDTIERWSASDRPARTIAHAGSGTLWVQWDADAASVTWFPRLAALAQEQGGHAVVVSAPPALKEGIDIWSASPPGLAIMREIKRQFDPQGILNPGRFLAGL